MRTDAIAAGWKIAYGVSYPTSGSAAADATQYAHGVHVVIDAQTGADLELFSYH